MKTAPTVYEQPLNERMRTFLRLDFLYQQTLYHEERADPWSTRAAMSSLLEILAITARGDIRSEVLKELERQMAVMHEYAARPGVDGGRLKAVLSNLTNLRTELNSAGAMFMQRLRDSEFLNAIKHRSAIPGGTCEFDLPDYRHWLDQPFEQRTEAFNGWMSTIRPLCDAVTELLWLTRGAARPRPETAAGGTFQLTFERENPCQLIRITLPPDTHLFPEISGSHHRCSIRFMTANDVNIRPVQTGDDVKFLLTTCT
ncbi:cell division protein ZapD [Povalibacter sp.]|uniref:cell division protein ZapD n=1 Tax=Povalibacter sp. TaxID=1962978 RepID=UPI002F3ED2BA